MDELSLILDVLRDIDSDTKAVLHIFSDFENYLENENRKDAKKYVQLFRIFSENINERIYTIASRLDKYILDIESSKS